MAKIFLVRHGRTEHDGRFVGVTESLLAQSGIDDIKTLKESLSRVPFSHVYCSPKKRCLQTASLLGYDGILEIEDGLKEIDFGKWEGLSFKEVSSQFHDLFQQLAADPLRCSFPEGQSMEIFSRRVQKSVENICATLGFNENILIISHGGVLRILLCYLLGIPFERLNAFSPAPGRYCVVDYVAGTGVVEAFNLLTD